MKRRGQVLICFLIMFLLLSVGRLSGKFFEQSMVKYNIGRGEASYPYTVNNAVRHLAGPLTGYLGLRFGIRKTTVCGCFIFCLGMAGCYFWEGSLSLLICYGVINGLGVSLGTSLVPSILSIHCQENLVRAIGICYFGVSVGVLIMPLVCEVTLYFFGFSGTFLILAAIALNSVPLSMRISEDRSTEHAEEAFEMDKLTSETSGTAFAANPKNEAGTKVAREQEEGTSADGELDGSLLIASGQIADSDSEDFRVMKEEPVDNRIGSRLLLLFIKPAFILINVYMSVLTFARLVVGTVVIDLARDKGCTEDQDKYFLMCIAASDCIGCLAMGYIVDSGCVSIVAFNAFCFAGMALSCMCFAWVSNFVQMMMVLFTFTLMACGLYITRPSVVNETISVEHRTLAMASCYLLSAPLSVLVSPIIGCFRDSMGSYDGLLYLLSVLCIICCGVVVLLPWWARRRSSKSSELYESSVIFVPMKESV